jgi:hypothetical protein
MKEEIYRFVIIMIAKYGQFYIIIGRNNASRGIRSIPNETSLTLINLFRPKRE